MHSSLKSLIVVDNPCQISLFFSSAIIIFGVSGTVMVVVSFFTKKIPRSELGGLTWSTINEAPIAFGAIGEHHDHQKIENGTISSNEAVELIEKNGEIPLLCVCFCSILRTAGSMAEWFRVLKMLFCLCLNNKIMVFFADQYSSLPYCSTCTLK